MITYKKLRVRQSELLEYSPYKIYSKDDICLSGKRLYISLTNDNLGDSPALGTNWDQLF